MPMLRHERPLFLFEWLLTGDLFKRLIVNVYPFGEPLGCDAMCSISIGITSAVRRIGNQQAATGERHACFYAEDMLYGVPYRVEAPWPHRKGEPVKFLLLPLQE
jgi:hypothetical protein